MRLTAKELSQKILKRYTGEWLGRDQVPDIADREGFCILFTLAPIKCYKSFIKQKSHYLWTLGKHKEIVGELMFKEIWNSRSKSKGATKDYVLQYKMSGERQYNHLELSEDTYEKDWIVLAKGLEDYQIEEYVTGRKYKQK